MVVNSVIEVLNILFAWLVLVSLFYCWFVLFVCCCFLGGEIFCLFVCCCVFFLCVFFLGGG